jgi:hypothetical protein
VLGSNYGLHRTAAGASLPAAAGEAESLAGVIRAIGVVAVVLLIAAPVRAGGAADTCNGCLTVTVVSEFGAPPGGAPVPLPGTVVTAVGAEPKTASISRKLTGGGDGKCNFENLPYGMYRVEAATVLYLPASIGPVYIGGTQRRSAKILLNIWDVGCVSIPAAPPPVHR